MKAAPALKQEKLITPAKARIILVVATLIYIILGLAIGNFFVWDQYDTASRYQQEINDAVLRVQDKPNDISLRLELGFYYTKAGKYTEAQREYNAALSIDPNSTLVRLNMANLQLEMKKYEAVQQLLNEVVQSDPNYQAYFLLGKSDFWQKKYSKAIQEFISARDLNPTDTETLYYLGLSYENTGNKKTAAETYRELLQYDPSHQGAQKALKRVGLN